MSDLTQITRVGMVTTVPRPSLITAGARWFNVEAGSERHRAVNDEVLTTLGPTSPNPAGFPDAAPWEPNRFCDRESYVTSGPVNEGHLETRASAQQQADFVTRTVGHDTQRGRDAAYLRHGAPPTQVHPSPDLAVGT